MIVPRTVQHAVVLLSGGLDSTVATYIAAHAGRVELALSFDYGQKAGPAELQAAALTCRRLKIPHRVMHLPWLKEICPTALVNFQCNVPQLTIAELDQPARTQQSAAAVWVPNRNGLFLNIAATYAEALQCPTIVAGFNAEEGDTFPDNSSPFVEAANAFFRYSTLNHPQIVSPTLQMMKTEIVREALQWGIAWDQIWPCYLGRSRWCGGCESCLRTRRAFQTLNLVEPLSYFQQDPDHVDRALD